MGANLKQLIEHRHRLSECATFEAFKETQLMFVDLLIGNFREEDRALRESARLILESEAE